MNAAIQMESVAVPFRCTECSGYGLVTVCGHMGACPCDGAECPVCGGTGYAPCEDCGENPATDLTEQGKVCRCCKAAA